MAGMSSAAGAGITSAAIINSLKGQQNSAGSVNNSYNYTNGAAATQSSIDAAALANQLYMQRWEMEKEYNSAEAQKNRDWQEKMSNTAYQRAVTDLKAAGINPILASIVGGAQVGSGAVASTNAHSATMANSYADSYGESHGSSWSEGASGLMTGIGQIFQGIGSLIDTISDKITNTNSGKKAEETNNKANEKLKDLQKQGKANSYVTKRLKDYANGRWPS